MAGLERYRIETLTLEARPVMLSIAAGEALGYLKYTRSGRRIFRLGDLRRSVDLPKHAQPSLWRPTRPDLWPEALPEPVTEQRDVAWQSPPVTHGPAERPISNDGWPYPGLRLGRPGSVPRSEQEAEARVLRAMRTHEALFADRRAWGPCLWPKDLVIAAAVVGKMLETSRSGRLVNLRIGDYDDFHHDRSDLRPLPARWMPTPRDVSDVGFRAHTKCLSHQAFELLVWRAALPPFSWTQIAELRKSTEATVESEYRAAVAQIFARARVDQ